MSDRIKHILKEFAPLIIAALLILIVCTYDDGTPYSSADVDRFEEQARQEGYNEGYREGYEEGYDNGHDDGYLAGYNDK